jgi:hypothetical protein
VDRSAPVADRSAASRGDLESRVRELTAAASEGGRLAGPRQTSTPAALVGVRDALLLIARELEIRP